MKRIHFARLLQGLLMVSVSQASHHFSGQLSGLLSWVFQTPSVFVSKQLGGRN